MGGGVCGGMSGVVYGSASLFIVLKGNAPSFCKNWRAQKWLF
jgi:hypothetical protein